MNQRSGRLTRGCSASNVIAVAPVAWHQARQAGQASEAEQSIIKAVVVAVVSCAKAVPSTKASETAPTAIIPRAIVQLLVEKLPVKLTAWLA